MISTLFAQDIAHLRDSESVGTRLLLGNGSAVHTIPVQLNLQWISRLSIILCEKPNFKLRGSTSEAILAVLQDAWMKLGPVSFNLVGSAFATTWLKLRLSIFSLSETKRLQMFYLAMPLSFIVSFVVVVMFLKNHSC